MNSVLNRNISMYIEPFENGKVLPRLNYCAVIRCLSFHYGQPKIQRKLTCTQCLDTKHTINSEKTFCQIFTHVNNDFGV